MTAITGTAAAVTGAASGIGRALALELAARGCDLALADRDEAGLQTARRRDRQASGSARSRRTASMSASPARSRILRRPRSPPIPALNIVINNAGVALLGSFDEVDQAQMDWLININFWGVVHGTRAFLPHLAKQPRGAYRQPVLDLRHHRPARPDRLLRGEIRGARLFRKPAA